jgi:hypothetical protein
MKHFGEFRNRAKTVDKELGWTGERVGADETRGRVVVERLPSVELLGRKALV